MLGHDLIDAPQHAPSFAYFLISRSKQKIRRMSIKPRIWCISDRRPRRPLVLLLPLTPHVAAPYAALHPRLLDQQADRDALFDVEDVFVLAAVGGDLLLLGIAVEVDDVDLIEAAHQRLTHPAESRVVEEAVVGHDRDDALSGRIDLHLSKADKLDVVVLQPLRVFLAERDGTLRAVVAGLHERLVRRDAALRDGAVVLAVP